MESLKYGSGDGGGSWTKILLQGAMVLCAGLLVGAILCLPELLMLRYRQFYRSHFPEVVESWGLNGRFSVVSVIDDPDLLLYAGRAAEAAKHLIPFDPNIKEDRTLRLATCDVLGFMILGGLQRAFGFNGGWLAARALAGAAWFWTSYLLVFEISRLKMYSLAWAVFLSLFFDLLGPIWTLKDIAIHIPWLLGNYKYNFGPSRMISPAFSYPALFICLYLAAITARTSGYLAAAGMGIALAAMSYIHADVWHVGMASIAIFSALCCFQDGHVNRRLITGIALGLILSLPWMWFNYPLDHEMLMHVGIDGSRWLLISATTILIGCAGIIGRKLRDRRDYFWAAILLMVMAVGRGVSYAAQRFPYQGLPRDIDQALRFLESKTMPGSKVAVLGPIENLMIPAFTGRYTMLGNGSPLVSDISIESQIARMKQVINIYGISPGKFLAYLYRLDSDSSSHWENDLWRGKINWEDAEDSHFFYYYFLETPREIVTDHFSRLMNSVASNLETDYVWVGPFEIKLMSKTPESRFGKPIYRNGNIKVFKFQKR